MPRSAPTPQPDPGGPITLRPRSAIVICVVSGALGLVLGLEAVIRAGWQGALVLPSLLLVLALVWMLLWAPRVVLHEDTVEVRNILVTHVLPFPAIRAVRLGAMLRFDTVTAKGSERTVTAWNAPGLRRDNPLRREAAIHEESMRSRQFMNTEQRRRHDEADSRAHVVRQRWNAWMDRHETAPGTPHGDGEGGPGQVMVTRANVRVLGVVGLCLALMVARLAI